MEPAPSTLFLVWPWEEPPTEEEVRLRLDGFATQQPFAATEDLRASAWRTEDHAFSFFVWGSSMPEGIEGMVGERAGWGEGERERTLNARWRVWVETLLEPDAPLSSFHRQLKFCTQLCPDLPGLYDATALRLRPGVVVRRLTETDVPPRTTELYQTHAVAGDEGAGCWLHTHGLQRAGHPDLELIGIPKELYPAGASLFESVVGQFLGGTLPADRATFELGTGINLSWCPWESVVEGLESGVLGGQEDREDGEHGGSRSVLLSPDGPLAPPLGALQRVDVGDFVPYVSVHETQRMALLARERWHVFGMRFVTHKADEGWEFLVKLGYEVDGEQGGREHLWFKVLEIVPDRMRARLLNAPLGIERMSEGQEGWHELARLSDWTVLSPDGEITPDTADD